MSSATWSPASWRDQDCSRLPFRARFAPTTIPVAPNCKSGICRVPRAPLARGRTLTPHFHRFADLSQATDAAILRAAAFPRNGGIPFMRARFLCVCLGVFVSLALTLPHAGAKPPDLPVNIKVDCQELAPAPEPIFIWSFFGDAPPPPMPTAPAKKMLTKVYPVA